MKVSESTLVLPAIHMLMGAHHPADASEILQVALRILSKLSPHPPSCVEAARRNFWGTFPPGGTWDVNSWVSAGLASCLGSGQGFCQPSVPLCSGPGSCHYTPVPWETAQGSPAHRITCPNPPHRAVSTKAWGEDRATEDSEADSVPHARAAFCRDGRQREASCPSHPGRPTSLVNGQQPPCQDGVTTSPLHRPARRLRLGARWGKFLELPRPTPCVS